MFSGNKALPCYQRRVKDREDDDILGVFNKALDNIRPMVEVKSRRVGGSNYQVP